MEHTNGGATVPEPIVDWLAALGPYGVTESSEGGWLSRCPAHDDQNPSLKVDVGRGERVLLVCRAGCETSKICDALGKPMASLFALGRPSSNGNGRWEKVGEWAYRDEKGAVLFTKIRSRKPDGSKNYHYLQPNGEKNIRGCRRVPFQLDRLAAAPRGSQVLVLEGEKCCEAAASLGLLATCNLNGANKWKELEPAAVRAALAAQDVAILPDADEPGRDHAADVAKRVRRIARSVRIVELPGLAEKEDIADWAAARHARPAEEIRAELEALIAAAPEWNAGPVEKRRKVQPAIDAGEEEPVHRTDLGNARRLRRAHGDDLRFCHDWKRWLAWDGRRWEKDATGEVLRRARDVAGDRLREAADLPGGEERDAEVSFAFQCESQTRIRAMVSLLESEPGIPVLPDDLDRATWVFNTLSGTVDLRSGAVLSHDRGHLITLLAGGPYDPAATCPLFERFVLEIMDGNERLAAFLQRVFGYAATGDCSERRLFVLWGSGKNGKSLLLTIIGEAFADYAKKIAVSSLLVKKGDTIPNDIAALQGARLVFAAESAEGKRLDEGLVKELTGREPIAARFMRGEWFRFIPEFVPFLATNHKPVITGTDLAIWDRVSLVPFVRRFDGAAENKGLVHALRKELPGILAWIVRGAAEWQRVGLAEPDEVRAATATYREESDRLAEFISEECILGVAFRVAAGDLYRRYKAWCESRGESHPMAQRTIGERLRERGIEPHKGTSGVRMWWGIGLLPRAQNVSGGEDKTREPGEEADLS